MGFMEDIEEDPAMRNKINIYRDPSKPVQDAEIPNFLKNKKIM